VRLRVLLRWSLSVASCYLLFETSKLLDAIPRRPSSAGLRYTVDCESIHESLFERDLWHRRRKNAPRRLWGELSKLTIAIVDLWMIHEARKRGPERRSGTKILAVAG
jgi:hypothetical protein